MRTSRCIFYTFLGTLLCLLYVFQQTEIVKLGYRIKQTEKVLEACLDRKTALQYTLSSLESPVNIDKSLFLNGEVFEIANDYKLVRLEQPAGQARPMLAKAENKPKLRRLAMLSWLADKTAQAQTVK